MLGVQHPVTSNGCIPDQTVLFGRRRNSEEIEVELPTCVPGSSAAGLGVELRLPCGKRLTTTLHGHRQFLLPLDALMVLTTDTWLRWIHTDLVIWGVLPL